jgi:hypothetical protein
MDTILAVARAGFKMTWPDAYDALANSLHPLHYSGGVAATLTPYLTVLDEMRASSELVIAGWAAEQLASVRTRIEQDRERESRDEGRFEW